MDSYFLSDDGLQLWFASDRPGSVGERDLWFSTRASTKAAWSKPVNAGPGINSVYDEESPTLTADGRALLFESMRPTADDNTIIERIWTASRRHHPETK